MTFLYGAHVRANGIRQHYYRYGGAGEPLIVLPGIASPAATWRVIAERLGRAYDTYVLDVRGRGLSEGGANLDYSLDTYAKDVAEFAAALKLGPCAVLGHSMGARIAIRLARRHGATASRLALVDPPVSGPGRRPYVYTLPFYLENLREAKAGRLDVQAMRPKYPKWSEEELYLRAEWAPTCDEKAIAETVRSFHEDDIHADLPALRLPMLLVVAGSAGVILDEDVAEIRRLAPAMQVTKVEGAGHMIPFEDREGFFKALSGFLKTG